MIMGIFNKTTLAWLALLLTTAGLNGESTGRPETPDPVAERLRTDPLMMPYYTGRILPTPQEATYRDEFLAMDRVVLEFGKDVPDHEPLAALLTERIVRYGGAVITTNLPGQDCSCVISLGATSLANAAAGVPDVPAKPEGYILHCTRADGNPLVILKGHDRTGLLWAISSLIQLVHRRDNRTVTRAAEVRDYPRMLKRGYISVHLHSITNATDFLDYSAYTNEPPPTQGYLMPPAPYTVEKERCFATLCKFNQPVYRALSFQQSREGTPDWHNPSNQAHDNRNAIRDLKEMISPLGIKWYGGFDAVRHPLANKIRADDLTRQALLHYARQIEDAGGHFVLMLDDLRFPLHPYDREHFQTARAADTWIITNLVADIRADYPDARLLVCPPFYWGPAGNSHEKEYGENRAAYLDMIGKAWPAWTDVFWSGARVNVTLSAREDIEWIRAQIKRKPFFYQNRRFITGCHGYHYGAEPVNSLPARYWDGFFEAIEWFGPNSQMPRKCIVNAIVADFMWNPEGYNATNSVREAAGKLIAPEAWATLARFTKALSFFNQFYPEGLCDRTTAQSRRDAALVMDEVETHLAEAEACLMELKARFPAAIRHWTDSGRYTGTQHLFVDELRKDEKLKLFRDAVGQRKQAIADGVFDPATDIFLPACVFGEHGMAETRDVLDGNTGPAFVLGDVVKSGKASFVVRAETADREWELFLYAQRATDSAAVSVTVNKKRLSGEPAPLAADSWKLARIRIPAGCLLAGRANTLVIEARQDPQESISLSTAEDADQASLRIRYAVLKPSPADIPGSPRTGSAR